MIALAAMQLQYDSDLQYRRVDAAMKHPRKLNKKKVLRQYIPENG